MAYQLNRPDLGQGLLVVLRRPDSPYESARFPLRALEEKAAYRVTNLDTGEQRTRSGKELLHEGLSVLLQARPDSALLTYERQ